MTRDLVTSDMQLSREDGRDHQISTRADLERAIADLGTSDEGSALLERRDGSFVQATGSRPAGFVFEVREGKSHLQSRRKNLSYGEIVPLFVAWLHGDERWRTAIEWEPGDSASGSAFGWFPATRRHAMLAFAVALLAAGAAEWLRQARGERLVLLYAFAVVAALTAARIVRDVSRRERAKRGNGAADQAQLGSAPRGGSPNRMMRG
jgi:hypothetical protein